MLLCSFSLLKLLFIYFILYVFHIVSLKSFIKEYVNDAHMYLGFLCENSAINENFVLNNIFIGKNKAFSSIMHFKTTLKIKLKL